LLHWERLFAERWADSENGRGMKDVLRLLGRQPTDSRAGDWLLERTSRPPR
jgi:hypothetical protein